MSRVHQCQQIEDEKDLFMDVVDKFIQVKWTGSKGKGQEGLCQSCLLWRTNIQMEKPEEANVF
jgi:hypothetical protein